ncbi:MAG: PEGA domain-containing protein [Patescibacteria group bacterium]|jgi:hypothetical protein
MTYQKNWPTLLAYVLSTLVFIVVAVYAIGYATGYRLDLATWTIQKTGVLAISSKPSGATVYINDHKTSRLTPITMRNVLPGAYNIKLELKDYRPFFKTIDVASRQVVEEHNLDLVLTDIPSQILVEDAQRVISVGNDLLYFSKDRKFIKYANGTATPLDFSRLPANVKSVLQATTDVYLAKKSDGNTWALGVISGGRKWLVVADFQEGYRGQLFGSPLNQATAEKLSWLDNDRLMAVMGTTVYAVDLNLNRINLYAKNILGASYSNSRLYYIIRNSNGSISLMRDSNLFDDKAGEAVTNDLPVGKSYEIVFVNDERIIVTAKNSTAGLWLWDKTVVGKNEVPIWTKVASNIGDVYYEHHNLKPRLFYTVGRNLMSHNFVNQTEMTLKNFPAAVELLGKQDESLFLTTNNQLNVSDVSGTNVYTVADVNKTTVYLGSDAKKIWLLKANKLVELILRQNDSNIFGGLGQYLVSSTVSI